MRADAQKLTLVNSLKFCMSGYKAGGFEELTQLPSGFIAAAV